VNRYRQSRKEEVSKWRPANWSSAFMANVEEEKQEKMEEDAIKAILIANGKSGLIERWEKLAKDCNAAATTKSVSMPELGHRDSLNFVEIYKIWTIFDALGGDSDTAKIDKAKFIDLHPEPKKERAKKYLKGDTITLENMTVDYLNHVKLGIEKSHSNDGFNTLLEIVLQKAAHLDTYHEVELSENATEKALDELFDLLDTNGDGNVDDQEFMKIMEFMPKDGNTLHLLFASFDLNGNSEISREEFKTQFHNMLELEKRASGKPVYSRTLPAGKILKWKIQIAHAKPKTERKDPEESGSKEMVALAGMALLAMVGVAAGVYFARRKTA